MKIIKSFDQLDQWLEENDYFEEGYVLKVEKSPLAITVGYLISGNYEAHTEKQILSFTITPSKIREWNNPQNFVPSEDHIIERIEALEFDHGKGGIGLQFLVPPLFTLVAESFTISDPEIIKTFSNLGLATVRFMQELQWLKSRGQVFGNRNSTNWAMRLFFATMRGMPNNHKSFPIQIIQVILFNLRTRSKRLSGEYSYTFYQWKIIV